MRYATVQASELRLSITDLCKSYHGNFVALDRASAVFKPGITGLVGPNGAGKSTLLKLLAQLERPSQGNIIFNQGNATENPNIIRRTLGLLPQHFGIYEHLSAREFLRYLAAVKGLNGEAVEQNISDSLAKVNLTHVEHQALKSFSGGMRQRVGIAQTLLGEPDILIFDEPTVGLDPHERVNFRKLLTDLSRSKIVILSSHIVSDIASVADQILVLNQGSITAFDTPSNLLQRMEGKVWTVPIDESELSQFEQDYTVCDVERDSKGLSLRVVSSISPSKKARTISPNLEDAYLFFSNTPVTEAI
jgi:ABC-2 type transport system ATP-binding protein